MFKVKNFRGESRPVDCPELHFGKHNFNNNNKKVMEKWDT